MLVRTEMRIQPSYSVTAQFDGFLMSTLEVSDHGEAIPVEHKIEVPFAFGHFTLFARGEAEVEIFFTFYKVARFQETGVEHCDQVKELTCPLRIPFDSLQSFFFDQLEAGLHVIKPDVTHQQLMNDVPS